jgi:hypothetical protein
VTFSVTICSNATVTAVGQGACPVYTASTTVTVVAPPARLEGRIWTDKLFYRVGESIQICFSVSQPAYIRVTDFPPGAASKVLFEWMDDGRGDCRTYQVTPPTGSERLLLEIWANQRDSLLLPPAATAEAGFEVAPAPARTQLLIVAEPLTLSRTSVDVGSAVTARFTVQNVSDRTLALDDLAAAGRTPADWSGAVEDFPHTGPITLAPNQRFTYERARTFATPGDYFAEPVSQFNGEWGGIDNSNRVSFTVTQRQGIPSRFDLSSLMPPVGDQGAQGSCVGWAVAYYYKSFQEKKQHGWEYNQDHLFSPSYIYNQFARSNGSGMSIADGINVVVEEGVAPLALSPYDDSDWQTKPTDAAREVAANYKSARARQLSSGRMGLQEIKEHLAREQDPVIASIPLYLIGFDALPGEREWEVIFPQYIPTVIDIPSASDLLPRVTSGHAIVIVGYDDSTQRLKFINSWGTDWGESGFGYLTYTFFIESGSLAFVMEDGP